METILQSLKELNFTAIDFETANETRYSACSLGYAQVRNGLIVKSGNIFIRPKVLRISDINRQIHGITEASLADKSEFDELWPEIEEIFKNEVIIAHNCDFDIDVLKQTCHLYNLEVPKFKYLCSQKLVQEAFNEVRNYRLKDLADHFGINLSHHNSQSDAEACALLAIKSLTSGFDYQFSFTHPELTYTIIRKASETKTDRSFKALGFADKVISSNLLKPNLDAEDKEHSFYNKILVFTGDLKSLSRKEAATRVQALGADINTTISKKTQIVVIGEKAGPSKLLKIKSLIEHGCPIQMLNEEEFLQLLK